nr:outer membrane protein assembly factor BamC [Coxiella-like endosymbiont]
MQPSIDEQPGLIMSNNISQAWMKIGRALQKTSYQILDQDSMLSSFYILDIKSTNNKITKATPIYRIYLKPQGHQTQVVLLNKNNQPVAKDVAQRVLSDIQQKVV